VILQITSTFTNSEFVPIWYIWIAVSAIGILCIKQWSSMHKNYRIAVLALLHDLNITISKLKCYNG
jgi:hypothetical protein